MNKKDSLILGALTSSAGIFITKLLGIFYMSPFTALAGEENIVYYSYAYGVYDTLLNISLAGIPYAIATLVSKYYLKDDYIAINYIKKLSRSIMLGFGFIAIIVVAGGSGLIAKYITPSNISAEGLKYTRNVLVIISLAFFSVPLLSNSRGYYQGLKDMSVYAKSQVLEQISRITFLLTCAFVCTSILKLDGIYAIYGAVFSAFFSSIIALIYVYFSKKSKLNEMKQLALEQNVETVNKKVIIKELFSISIPYLASSILGNSMNIVNTLFFSKAMDMAGYAASDTTMLNSMIMTTTNKLTSIPTFIATGFSIAIIPYITSSIENNDLKKTNKYILDCLNSVFYLGLPICFFLFALPKEIYYVMYGANSSYKLGGEVLKYMSIYALCSTISPVCTSLTLALKLRKQNIINLIIGFLIKLVSFFPFILLFGYQGAIYSSILCSIVIISLNIVVVCKKYKPNIKKTIRLIVKELFGLLLMSLSFVILKKVGFNVVDQSRIKALMELSIFGIIGLVIYFIYTYLFKLPQTIFHFKFNNKKN